MVGAYLRVSSRGQSLEMQRAAIERASVARGETVSRWWEDTASGRSLERPQLQELRGAAARGELKKLYVFRLDRLTRSGIRDTLTVIEEFRRAGVQIVSLADGFDPSGPMAEVVIAVISWAAQIERLAIGERISAARERLAAAGKPWGRPRRITERTLARLLERREQGASWNVLAAEFGLPKSTIQEAVGRSHPPKARPKTLGSRSRRRAGGRGPRKCRPPKPETEHGGDARR